MKLTIIGTGYVGLVSGTCLAEHGHTVTGVDIDRKKIALLKKGQSPIYEEGLAELIKRNITAQRLFFTTDLAESAPTSEVISIAVGTPSAPDGSVDLTHVKQAAKDIARVLTKVPKDKRLPHYVIATKSTVPIGTGQLITDIIKKYYHGQFSVISNPEFLREGQAVWEFLNPDRTIIGVENDSAKKIMTELYSSFPGPILTTNRITAELIKYAANSYLATSISFINSLSQLAEKVGADITQVSEGLRLDKRIGRQSFVTAGPAWGGSCFPKDVRGLAHFAKEIGVELPLVEATLEVNERQRRFVVEKIRSILKNLHGKKLAIWGLAFKPGTDDVRESPAIEITKLLTQHGATIHAYDPIAESNARAVMPDIFYAPTPYETAKAADAIIVLTDWPSFKSIDFKLVAQLVKQPFFFDMRNIFEPATLKKHGFNYIGLGRQ